MVVIIVLLAALVVVNWHRSLPLLETHQTVSFPVSVARDSEAYAALATDGVRGIESPFSKRILYPWLVGVVSRALHQSVDRVFAIANLLALLGVAWCLAEISRDTVGQAWWALLLLLTPFPLESFELAYLPDLFHIALVSAYFLLLLRQHWIAAGFLLMAAFLTRENTLILCGLTALLAWRRRQFKMAGAAAGIMVAGWTATSWVAKMGRPNLHNLPDFIYLLGKLPYYFLLSLFGVRVWSNVRPDVGQPFVRFPLPTWIRIGDDRMIGLTHPDWHYPASTLIIWLTVFGVGPLIMIHLWRSMGKLRNLPFAIEVALLYGAVSFLLGPFLGDWADRLVGYGWPLFWIALPCIAIPRFRTLQVWEATMVAVCYSLTSWWPRFFHYGNDRSINPWPCSVVLLFYLITALQLRKTKVPATDVEFSHLAV
jgi:hypothetical protein